MTLADDTRAIVARLRDWGYSIREEAGCYGRSNGTSWSAGRPEGHVAHHYVCSLNSSQSYIDGLVANLKAGATVQWFADVNGRGYLIGDGPANHAGTGNSSVLAGVRADKAPPGPASSAGDMSGNQALAGTECQHPGDSTPWPTPMVDLLVAIAAASALQYGWTANRVIQHYEWTARKIDCSAAGGPASGAAAGTELRRRVAQRMGGDQEMNDEDRKWITDQLAALPDKVWRRKVTGPGTGDAGLPADEVIRRTGRSTGALPDE